MFRFKTTGMLAAIATIALMAPLSKTWAQAYPSKPITFIVPYSAGGSSDTRSRQLAQHMSETLGVSVVVENRPGASGNIGTTQIARAQPDGYTIGLGNFAPMAVNKSLYGNTLTYDVEKDIQPIALIERGAVVLAVNKASPHKDLAALLAFAKANPGKLNYASTGAGGASHLSSELMKQRAGVDVVHVPYKGGAPALNDLMGGNVDMYLELPSLFIPQLAAAEPRIRPLAAASENRLKALPDVPTFKELGVDMVASNWFGVVGPKGLPADVLTKLNAAVNKALQDPGYRKVVESQGAEVPGGTPEEFAKFIQSESALWGKLISDQKISVQ